MPRFRRNQPRPEEQHSEEAPQSDRIYDNFLFDASVSLKEDAPAGDTFDPAVPEEAPDPQEDQEPEVPPVEQGDSAEEMIGKAKSRRSSRAGEELQLPEEAEEEPPVKTPKTMRSVVSVLITVVLLGILGCNVLFRITGMTALSIPEDVLSSAVTPVQTLFSGVVESVYQYLQGIKRRQAIE